MTIYEAFSREIGNFFDLLLLIQLLIPLTNPLQKQLNF